MGGEFRVLGPLEVLLDGAVIPLPSGRARVLLATLLLRSNQVVPVDELVDRLWDGAPPNPSRAKATLQMVVTRLRQSLGDVDVVRTASGGYLAEIAPETLDLHRFRSLADAGQFAEALGLWRGAPLSDVASDALHRDDVPALVDERLEALERRIDADLDAGHLAGLVVELRALTKRHPLRERFWAQLMLALYRSDQQAEALTAYRTVSALLADELGVDPGQGLRQLHKRILDGDASLAPRHEPDRAGGVIPRQLPNRAPYFVGRDAELAELSRLLDVVPSDGGAVVISAIKGAGGIGKTTLAVHWAHHVADRFSDGQLYANLRGFDPAIEPTPTRDVLRGFLEALGVPAERAPVDLDGRIALYRTLMARRSMLVLLDNARDADQVRPLLPGDPSNLVLVTSRSQLTGLVAREGAHLLTLDVLNREDAGALLERRIGPDRLAAEPEAVEVLIERCSGLPLALAIVGARAVAEPGFPLRVIAAELSQEAGRLDALATDDITTSVRTVFSWSYRNLGDQAAHMFRLLSVHPGPEFSTSAAASTAGVPVDSAGRVLGELAQAHLLVQQSPGRFVFHDLVRAYAAECAREQETVVSRGHALRRLLDHYVHTANRAELILAPHRERLNLVPLSSGVAVEDIQDQDQDQALSWFDTEYQVLLAVVGCAAANGFDVHCWQTAKCMVTYFHSSGHYVDWTAVARTALEAGHRLDDRLAQAYAHRALGQSHTLLRDFDEARHHLDLALGLFEELDDVVGQAYVQFHVSGIHDRLGQMADSLHHAKIALSLYRRCDHLVGQGRTLTSIGENHRMLGDNDQALAYGRQALELFRLLNDRPGEASALDALGSVLRDAGDFAEAIKCHQLSVELFRAAGERYYETVVWRAFAETHQAAGDDDRALEAYGEALTILETMRHPEADTVRAGIRALIGPEPPLIERAG